MNLQMMRCALFYCGKNVDLKVFLSPVLNLKPSYLEEVKWGLDAC